MSGVSYKSKSSNWFTGSIYVDHILTSNDVIKFFTHPRIEELWFQKERGEEGNLHWQYTFRSTIKTTKMFFWKGLNYRNGEWIDVCRSPSHSIDYCNKAETRIEGPYQHTYPPLCPCAQGWLQGGRRCDRCRIAFAMDTHFRFCDTLELIRLRDSHIERSAGQDISVLWAESFQEEINRRNNN